MGKGDAARTERKLAELRARIERDVALLKERAREDLDVRRFVARRPVPVLGGAAAAATLLVAGIARRVAEARRRRPMREIDLLIERLGGRVDRLKKKQRERLREAIRKEVGEVEMGTRLERTLWAAVAAGLSALATALARRSASVFLREPPRDTEAEREEVAG